jgi:uncharacterized membrane protein YphA (DoxX/SURF4 family)
MLSLFPSFLNYSAIAVAVIRVVVAIIFIMEGQRGAFENLPKKNGTTNFYKKIIPIIELIGGIFLLGGLFTQAIAIILGAVSLKKTYIEYKKDRDECRRVSFFLLLFIISISFLFLGPGLWSIDYPL